MFQDFKSTIGCEIAKGIKDSEFPFLEPLGREIFALERCYRLKSDRISLEIPRSKIGQFCTPLIFLGISFYFQKLYDL